MSSTVAELAPAVGDAFLVVEERGVGATGPDRVLLESATVAPAP
ncbi:MAG: hypothetical protein JWR45_1278, partial [Blastococcus sp.]|nr:hypothetical protein [Blastococcus sp.]